MKTINLRENPFYLDDNAISWVQKTLEHMTLEQKCGQLFCPMGFSSEEAVLKHLIHDIGVGGMMYRPDFAINIQNTYKKAQAMANIPMLLAANTEVGGDGLAYEGTSFGKPMAVAATNLLENAYKMGLVACSEGAAMGLNWSFAPIVDINYEFHNPITNVRTFGSNPTMVEAFAAEYMKAADACDVAVAIKHFPGDGVDERDQHIVTSVNSFDTTKWDETYGYVYKNLIQKGAKTVMVGHIALPSYVKVLNPTATKKDCLKPATLSKELLNGLLRTQLGFNGLICTDATPMVGFTAAMPRKEAIPTAIACGCDMILFNKDVDEDYRFMIEGVASGLLSEDRLNEAVTRILATKASLHLHEKKETGTLVPDASALKIVGNQEYKSWAKKVADQAITLVKDDQAILPLSKEKFRRVYLNVIQKDLNVENEVVKRWKARFEAEGFEVTVRNRSISIVTDDFIDMSKLSPEKGKLMHEMYRSVEEMKQDYDLYVYICNMENASNNTTLRLNWNVCFGLGDDAPWFASEIPTLMISTAYPYHLFDAPMVGTYINCYSGNDYYLEAVMEKLMGRSEFKGTSPVDPFCGKDYI